MYILLSFISMLFTSIHKVLEKEVANQGIKTEIIFIHSQLFMGIFKVLIILFTMQASFVFRPQIMLLLLPNILLTACYQFLYFKSIKRLPVSITAPLFLLYFPVSMLLSIGFLKESVSTVQLFAMLVIFVIILVISIATSKTRFNKGLNKAHKDESRKHVYYKLDYLSRGILYVVVAGILQGVVIFLDKNAYNVGVTSTEMILYMAIANIIIAFAFYAVYAKTTKNKEDRGYLVTPLMVITAAIGVLSNISYVVAMQMGKTTIVIPIVVSHMILVSIFSNIFLKEKLKKYEYVCVAIFMICIFVLVLT